MSLVEFVFLLLIAGLAGGIGQALVGFPDQGWAVSVLTGLIGAFIGRWVAARFGLPPWLTIQIGGRAFPFFWAVIGSVLFAAVISLLRGD